MKIKKLPMPPLASAKAVVIAVQVVLCCAVDAVVTAIWNVMPALVVAKETVMDVLVTAMVVVLALAKQPVKMIVLALVMVAVCNHV